MKKVLSFLFCLTLLLSNILPISASAAESIDLKSMSTDELVELISRANSELHSRVGVASAVLYNKDYVVGTDIRAGEYILYLYEEFSSFSLYGNKEDSSNSENRLAAHSIMSGEEYRVTLTDGMVLVIYYAPCQIREAPAFLFAP